MAVHEQLLRCETGSWFQSVHRGYDDAWTWSGHRALTLPLSGWLYGWKPSALWLSQILTWCDFGIPAGFMGQTARSISLGIFGVPLCI